MHRLLITASGIVPTAGARLMLADVVAEAGGWVTTTNDLGREHLVISFELDHEVVDRMRRALNAAGFSVLDWEERGAGAPIVGSIAYAPRPDGMQQGPHE